MGWIDVLGCGLLLIFGVIGLLRGLWWQVVRLTGLVVAVALARALGGTVRELLRRQWPELDPRLAHGLAWVVIFLLVMIASLLIARFGRKAIEAAALGIPDRIGGLVVGLLTGLLFHAAVLVALCHLTPRPFVRSTLKGTTSRHIVRLVAAKWPVLVDRKAGTQLQNLVNVPGGRAPGTGLRIRPEERGTDAWVDPEPGR